MEYMRLFTAVAAWLALLVDGYDGRSREFVISMPNVSPQKKEAYFCTHKAIPIRRGFVVSFEALATQSIAHHVLLYGCHQPGSQKKTWDCAETSICEGTETILFAWAKDAPPLKLPGGVGFYVGYHTDVRHLVLQVHYAKQFSVGQTDNTGVKLHLITKRLKFVAGIFDFAADHAEIPPKAIGYHSDIACRYKNTDAIVPFAYRVHTHKLGRVVSSYRVRHSEWTLIGHGNPQAPQAFYSISPEYRTRIRHGDGLATRCTFDAPNRTTVTRIGSTSHDEMCNFYIMYYIPFEALVSHGNRQHGCYVSAEKNYNFPADSDKKLSLHWYLKRTVEDDEEDDLDSLLAEQENIDTSLQLAKKSSHDDVAETNDYRPLTSVDASVAKASGTSMAGLLLVCVAVIIPTGFITSLLVIQGCLSKRSNHNILVGDIIVREERKKSRTFKSRVTSTSLMSSDDYTDDELEVSA